MRLALRTFALTVLLLMVGGLISDFFDTWDQAFQTGRDADYTFVLIAALAGSVFLALKSARVLRGALRIFRRLALELRVSNFPDVLDLHSTSPPMSPTSLRI